MNRIITQASQHSRSLRLMKIVFSIPACVALVFLLTFPTLAQLAPETNGFRIGERLTYTVSIGRLPNAGFAELYCVSRGRLADKDAIEIRAKFKTLDLASAFYLVDEERTTFVSPLTGLPLQTTRSENTFGLPRESVQSFLTAPTPHVDLLTLIYKLRQSGGTGSMTMQDGEKVYTVTFLPGLPQKQRTDAGEFETTLVNVQSDFFSERGISDVRVNLTTDDAKLPVLIRFRTAKGVVRAGMASVRIAEPEVAVVQPTPVPVRTPLPERTPKPVVTPTPYVDNLPLIPDLRFELGELLDYRITQAGQPVGNMRIAAKERKQVDGSDSLLLEATFSDLRGGSPLAAGDFLRAYVNPETLAPRQFEMRFAGQLRAFSNSSKFDQMGSVVTVGGKRFDAPVGTHSILSLLYAARSFNLKPSRDLNNPINDTRVAVFWDSQPYIFTLRPSPPEVITVEGKPVGAQLVTVTTKNPVLDQLTIRVWLGNDGARVPVRFMVGPFQADLVAATKVQPN